MWGGCRRLLRTDYSVAHLGSDRASHLSRLIFHASRLSLLRIALYSTARAVATLFLSRLFTTSPLETHNHNNMTTDDVMQGDQDPPQDTQTENDSASLLSLAAAIKENCAKSHAREHVVTCPTCYGELIELVRAEYPLTLTIKPGHWCYGRDGFLAELHEMLSSAKSYKLSAMAIDERIMAEKKQFVLERTSKDRSLVTLGEAALGKAVFQSKRNQPEPDVLGLIKGIIGAAAARRPESVVEAKSQTERLQAVRSRAERWEVSRNILFPDGVPDSAGANAMRKKIASGQSLGEAFLQENLDHERERLSREKAQLLKRIEEFRRAKAGFEAQKRKKVAAQTPSSSVADKLANVCATCDEAIAPAAKRHPCITCLVEANLDLQRESTVWCSTKCVEAAYVSLPAPFQSVSERAS